MSSREDGTTSLSNIDSPRLPAVCVRSICRAGGCCAPLREEAISSNPHHHLASASAYPRLAIKVIIVQERTQKNETRTRNRAGAYRFLPLEEDDHNDPHRLACAFTPASTSPCLAIKVVIVSNPKPKETSSRTSRRLPDSFFGGRRSRI